MTVELAKMILQPGVEFLIPGNSARSRVGGTVIAAKRAKFCYSCDYFGRTMTLTHRLDDCSGLRAATPLSRGK